MCPIYETPKNYEPSDEAEEIMERLLERWDIVDLSENGISSDHVEYANEIDICYEIDLVLG